MAANITLFFDISPDLNKLDALWQEALPAIEACEELVLFMSHYDKDERELYEIPEARAAWMRVIDKFPPFGPIFDKLNEESLACIKIHLAIDEGWPIYHNLDDREHLIFERVI